MRHDHHADILKHRSDIDGATDLVSAGWTAAAALFLAIMLAGAAGSRPFTPDEVAAQLAAQMPEQREEDA